MKEIELLFFDLIEKTKKLLENEKKRGNTFLILGVVIAGIGIYYFIIVTNPSMFIKNYLNHDPKIPESLLELTKKDGFYSLWLFSTLPKTIAFIFIEYFAFFFFRLYNSSQNIKNKLIDSLKIREENYVLFSVYSKQKKELNPNELFDRICFFDSTDILGRNQFSKFLEREKLTSGETNIINDILNLLKRK